MNKSLCPQAMIFHVTLQILQISFFIQHRISKAKRNPNASKLYTALFSPAQCHENKWWQLPFFVTKTRMGLSPSQGAGQPHSTQPRVLEKSARGSLQTQSSMAGATEGMDGSLLRDPGYSGSCPEGQGVPSTPLFHTFPFYAKKGIRKSVLSSNTLLQTWVHGISSAGEDGWAAWGVALPTVMC